MKAVPVLLSSIILFSLLQSCQQYEPQDLYGTWQIDKILLDAMDRTEGSKQGFPWGTGILLKPDGKFRTNFAQPELARGSWKISPNGDQLFLHLSSDEKSFGFNITLSQQYLVLKSLRWQVFLSRVDALPEPVRKEVNLANAISGTWYFYEMTLRDSVIQYPRTEKQVHWVQINRGGYYRSGEGRHKSFYGRWTLQSDTLTFTEMDRVWKEQWKVRKEEDILYLESIDDDQEKWYEVSLVHETQLTR
ncbi:hypothetical protein [Catalinimonas niigatensis]|uniref:hypothetical protein n=1 Tax=Catalinimonas niigatensis TaxID=1397264 RepID=UPI0026666567|nr:hypothetical protein [Catalinimonas niigatensis]WPP53569.1 hypothetical protein PZB72_14445 [Catalinimonas niigatensis]